MATRRSEYRGHRIELRGGPGERTAEVGALSEAATELLIDGKPVPFGRLPDGSLYLEEYAYAWKADLVELATDLIDYRERAQQQRRPAGGR